MRAIAVLAGLVLAGACSGAGPLEVRKVLVDVEPAAVAGAGAMDREQVRSVVDEVLRKARGVKLVEQNAAGAVLRVRLEGYGPAAGDQQRKDGGQKTTLALTVEVVGAPGEPTGGGYRGHAIASGIGTIDARTLVAQALRDALAQVFMTRNAAELDSKELVSWLDDDAAGDISADTSERKRRAVRILGSRRERSAVEPLSRVLVGGDVELQPLALAALTNIGDPSAVDAVIAYSDRQPPVLTKQCIEAVRSMGSPRARAWLFTLSTGHPDLDVQQQAAAALASLETVPKPGVAGAVAEKAVDTPKNEATR